MFFLWSPCSWITSPYSGCSITVPLQANFCKGIYVKEQIKVLTTFRKISRSTNLAVLHKVNSYDVTSNAGHFRHLGLYDSLVTA